MRVLFLVHQYFPRYIGGTEMIVRGLVRRLRARGDEAGVVTCVESPSRESGDFGPRLTEWEGAPLWEIHYNLACDPHPARAEYDNPLIAEWVAGIAHEFRADIVHAAHLMKLGATAVPRLKMEGFPVVVSLSDYWPLCMRHTLMKPDDSVCATGPDHPLRCMRCAQATHGFAIPEKPCASEAELWELARAADAAAEETPFQRDTRALAARKDALREALLCADRVVAQSEFQRGELVRHGFPAERLELCRHGVEAEEVAPMREPAPPEPGRRRRVVFIGTLVPQKGAHILLEALRRAPDAAVEIDVIGGPGHEPAYVERVRAMAAGDARVRMRGTVPSAGIREALAVADALALPSLGHENAPLVVKAALASGVPAAVSDIGTLSEMVDERSGWKLPPGDVGAWADWLRELGDAAALPRPDGRGVPTADGFAEEIFRVYGQLARAGQRRAVHLIDSLDRAEIIAPRAAHVQAQTFVIGRVSLGTVFAHPPSRIVWPTVETGRDARLEAHIGVKPSVWEKISAPVTFRVLLRDADGAERVVFERTLDPRNHAADRAWAPVSVDFAECDEARNAGCRPSVSDGWGAHSTRTPDVSQKRPTAPWLRLVFETCGPAEGVGFGWAGWGDPRVTFSAPRLEPVQTTHPASSSRRPDVFLITCDALRADHLGCYGAPANRTPHLDALAAAGFRVAHARAQSDTTLGSYASLLTGRLPHETGVIAEWGGLPGGMRTLPERFADAGYHTIFAPSEDELADAAVGITERFAEVIPCLGNPAQGSEITFRRVMERLRRQDDDRPLFVWLHLFEPHPPSMPAPYFAHRFWLGDPAGEHREDLVRSIRAIESALELDWSREALDRGLVPPMLLNRIEDAARTMTGQLGKGPDLAAHLDALGEVAWNGMPRARFLVWLEGQLLDCRARAGRASGELLAWLGGLGKLLAHSEADLLGWLDGVRDIRYPKALYAGAVAGVDCQVGRLVRELREAGRFDSSLIVFTAPHGEALDEEPMVFEHHVPAEFVLRVPLLIKPPADAPVPPRETERMDLAELGGFMLDAAGVERGADWPANWRGGGGGASFALGMQAGFACVYRGPFKLVRFHLPGMEWPWVAVRGADEKPPSPLLFGGEGGLDETRDIAAEHPDVARELAAELVTAIPLEAAKRCALHGGHRGRAGAAEPDVSVIIVDHNGLRHLTPCLASLRETRGVVFEVIVADNDSTDGSPEAVERDFPEVRVLRLGRNAGFGEANRRGAEIARGRLLVFLNNDTVVEPGWLAALVRAFVEDGSVAAACSTLVLIEEPHLYNGRGILLSRLGYAIERDLRQEVAGAPELPRVCDTIAPTGAAMMIRREDYDAMGGFDPAMFMYFEDVDIGWRLWLAGRRVVVVADSVVLHHGSATTRRRRSARWKHKMGHRHLVRTLIKCYEWPNLLHALKGHAQDWIRERDPGMAAAVIGWNLLHLRSALRERARIQRERRMQDWEFFDKELILRADRPDPPPVAQYIERGRRVVAPRPSRILMPGLLSAQGRLLSGWQLPESVHGESLRWTSGPARCFLRAGPSARGRLHVELALDQPRLAERGVSVACNGARESREADCSWQEFALPVVADASGRLDVEITVPSWRPADLVAGSDDTRSLGCMVRRIRFVPDEGADGNATATATVVITTCNARATVPAALSALAAESGARFDVVVVDDGSTDGTWDALRRWEAEHAGRLALKILREKSRGPAVARNLALRHATGEAVIFLGDDAVPEPGFVAAHLARHRAAGEPCVVIGRTEWAGNRARRRHFLKYLGSQPHIVPGRFSIGYDATFARLDGVNVSVARELLTDDPFNEGFSRAGWEMVELGYRLASVGVPLLCEEQAVARRARPERVAARLERLETLGRQRHLLHGLHPELRETVVADVGGAQLPWLLRGLAGGRARRAAWDLADRAGIPMPRWLCRAVCDSAFLRGWLAPRDAAP